MNMGWVGGESIRNEAYSRINEFEFSPGGMKARHENISAVAAAVGKSPNR